MSNQSRAVAFTVIELLIVITIIAVLVVMLLPAINAARGAATRTQCINNQHQIGVAVASFESLNTYFPPGQFRRIPHGDRWAWTVLVMPHLDEQSVYRKIDFQQPITSAHNRGTVTRPGPVRMAIPTFLCPSTRSLHTSRSHTHLNKSIDDKSVRGLATTDYLGVSGPHHKELDGNNKPFEKNRGILLVIIEEEDPDGVQLAPRVRVKHRNIKDGASWTLMMTECTGRGWAVKGMKGALYDGRNVCSVGKKEYKGPGDTLHPIPRPINMPTDIAWPNEQPYSDHPGGVNSIMADGSARFLSDETDRAVVVSLASRNGYDRRLPDSSESR